MSGRPTCPVCRFAGTPHGSDENEPTKFYDFTTEDGRARSFYDCEDLTCPVVVFFHDVPAEVSVPGVK